MGDLKETRSYEDRPLINVQVPAQVAPSSRSTLDVIMPEFLSGFAVRMQASALIRYAQTTHAHSSTMSLLIIPRRSVPANTLQTYATESAVLDRPRTHYEAPWKLDKIRWPFRGGTGECDAVGFDIIRSSELVMKPFRSAASNIRRKGKGLTSNGGTVSHFQFRFSNRFPWVPGRPFLALFFLFCFVFFVCVFSLPRFSSFSSM